MALVPPVNRFHKRISPEPARSLPQFKTPVLVPDKVTQTHPFIPFQTPKALRNDGLRIQLHGVIFV